MSDDTIPLASMFGHPAPMVMPPPAMSTPPEWAQGLVKAAAAPLTDAGAYLGGMMGGQMPFHLGEAMQEAVKFGSALVGPKFGAGTIAAMAAPVAKAGARLAPEAEQAVAQGIRGYHGSPFDFSAFDNNKIGTGEGAQAYGHGHYIAGNESTAEYYRNTLSQKAPFPGELNSMSDEAKTTALRTSSAYPDDPLRAAQVAQWGNIELRKMDQVKLAELLSKVQESRKGRMYEVNINAHPDQFLDWDKPLSKQHPQVQDALRNLGVPFERDYPKLSPRIGEPAIPATLPITGAEAYNSIASRSAPNMAPLNVVGIDKPVATNTLHQAGIPGIKYLDQGSRGSGTGTSNYVVFDPKLIDIIKKYGIGSLAFLGGANAVNNSQPVPFAGMNSQ